MNYPLKFSIEWSWGLENILDFARIRKNKGASSYCLNKLDLSHSNKSLII